MILRELTPRDEEAFWDCIKAWDDSPDFNFAFGLVEALKFESYLTMLKEMKEGINLPENYVPASTLFAFEGDVIVGKVSVRHELNQHLLNVGGHVGYGVLPEFRRRGYATKMLKAALDYCKTLKIDRVLITCDESNLPSEKVILKNGGVLENTFDPEDGSSKKKRFWVELT